MEKKNSNNNSNSGLPLVIIGIVLVLVVVGGWWLYQSSGSKSNSSNTNRAANSPSSQANNKPVTSSIAGAQPPHFKGGQNAPVVIEEFADFQCGTCATMHPLMNEINSIYGSRIKFIFRHYPLVQIHKNAYDAAVSAEAAGLQGKFWEMQNLIFQNQRNWSNVADVKPVFEGYAQTIGLDVEKFKSDIAGLNAKQRVNADLERGRSLSISSTPTIIINGQPVPPEQMKIDVFKQLIDAELAKTSSQQTQPNPPASTPANKSGEEKGIEKSASNTANSNAKK